MTRENAILDGVHTIDILTEFLAAHAEPTQEDWKRLIDAHPSRAGELADLAILHRDASHMQEEVERTPVEEAAFNLTVSRAVNLVHETKAGSLAVLKEKIAACQGPKVRSLAAAVELAAYPQLVSSVLAGTVQAPVRLITYLQERFDVGAAMLREYFQRACLEAPAPSFRSMGVKPSVAREPRSWREAVISLNLPDEETRRLLSFDEPDP